MTKKRPVNLAKLARAISPVPVLQYGLQINPNSSHPPAAADGILPLSDRSNTERHVTSRSSDGQAIELPPVEPTYSPQTIIRSIPRQSNPSIVHESQRSPSRSSSQSPNIPQDGYSLPSSEPWNPLGFMDDINLFSSFIDFEVSIICCLAVSMTAGLLFG